MSLSWAWDLTHLYLGENFPAAQMVVLIREDLGKFPESG